LRDGVKKDNHCSRQQCVGRRARAGANQQQRASRTRHCTLQKHERGVAHGLRPQPCTHQHGKKPSGSGCASARGKRPTHPHQTHLDCAHVRIALGLGRCLVELDKVLVGDDVTGGAVERGDGRSRGEEGESNSGLHDGQVCGVYHQLCVLARCPKPPV
jgi:hypothetical protein